VIVVFCLTALYSCDAPKNDVEISPDSEGLLDDLEELEPQKENISLFETICRVEAPDAATAKDGLLRLKTFTDCIEGRDYSKASAKKNLRTIGKCVADLKLIQQSYQNAFFPNLIFGYSDCDINSLLYLLAAEELDLPIYGLFAPEHMFVAYITTTDTVYWETLSNRQKRLSEFRLKTKLQFDMQCGGELFKPVSASDLLALLEYNQALDHHRRGNLDQAIQSCYRSILSSENWVSPWHAIARFFAEKGSLDEAEEAFLRARLLCPALISLRKDLQHFYKSIGCLEESNLL